MKLRVLNIIIGLFIAACTISSCLDSDVTEYEYSSNSSITAFSITDSIITYYSTVVDGVDTTLSTSVIGTDYPFVINQGEGLIYNADSLPVGTDISKVVVGITADTYGIYVVAETDSLWESTDSLNFESPIQFKVLAEDGTFGRTYTAKINVHQQDPETLSWIRMEGNFSQDIKGQKAVYANSTIYVFAEQDSQVAMTSSADGKAWTELASIDIPTKADYTSVMVWGNQFYILADNDLYASVNGLHWDKVETSVKIASLTANYHSANGQKMVGADTDNHYIETKDGIHWTRHEALPADFPACHVSFSSYPIDTNDAIYRTVVMGDNGDSASSDTTVVAWTQLHPESEWVELAPSTSSSECPNFENMSMIHYNGLLYTFGGTAQDVETFEPFSVFYQSMDNGITWESADDKVSFPEEFSSLYEQADGNYSCIVDNQNFIWIMWSRTGEVWRGRINKFGFDKQ